MRRPLACLPLLLLLAAASATTRPATALIEQLDDADPAVRRHAAAELQRLGPDATPDLVDAAHDPRPAVAEAAAALLLKRDWSAPGDDPQVVRLLRRYGELPGPDRAGPLTELIKLGLPNYRAVALRVLTQDPSDEVAWTVLSDVRADGKWLAELRELKVPPTRAPLLMFLARCVEFNGDHAGATTLCRQVLDAERQRPTAPGHLLAGAVDNVRLADIADGNYAGALVALHDQLARADDQATSQPELIGQLLELHARAGPFSGFGADLRAATADEGVSGLALGVLASRCHLPYAARLLTAAATADKPDEAGTDRADRYGAAADFLMHLNRLSDAEAVLQKLVAIDDPAARLKLPGGYTRLSDLYARRRQFQDAGDALQRAMDRQTGLQMLLNGVPWPLVDEQAQVYWYDCQAALAAGDTAAAAEQARKIVASGSADSRIFLDVYPTAEAVVSRDEMDAYFDRVYKLARSNTDFTLESPTELNDLAWLCARAGRRLDEARQLSERSNALSPDQSAFLDTLAEVRFRQGDPAAAVVLEERALAHQPDDADFMQGQLERFRAATTRPATRPK